MKKPYKIIIFIDSEECNDCRIKVIKQKWEPFINKNTNDSLAYIIIFTSSEPYGIKNTMEELDISLPYFLDIESSFTKLNKHIKLNKSFHTFLTIHNKVILAGDPTVNSKLKELYLNTMRENRL